VPSVGCWEAFFRYGSCFTEVDVFHGDVYSISLSEISKAAPVLSTMPWKRMREQRYSATILDLETRWRWVVSFISLPLYSPQYSLGGPQSRSERCRKKENILPLLGIERRLSSPSLYRLIIPAPSSSVSTINILSVKYRKGEDEILFVYFFKDADSYSTVTVSDGRILINDESERLWKEAIVA
jgi:hypothetical protein